MVSPITITLFLICFCCVFMLSVFPALHTSFFRRFAPVLALFSLGSRGIHALLLFLFWKKAQQQQTLGDATMQR